MISVLWEGRTVAWFAPDEMTVSPWDQDALVEVWEALKEPVTILRDEELPDGTIGRLEVVLEPGSPEHAREALLALPGRTVLVVDEGSPRPSGSVTVTPPSPAPG